MLDAVHSYSLPEPASSAKSTLALELGTSFNSSQMSDSMQELHLMSSAGKVQSWNGGPRVAPNCSSKISPAMRERLAHAAGSGTERCMQVVASTLRCFMSVRALTSKLQCLLLCAHTGHLADIRA